MCNHLVTKCSECGNEDIDKFPCEKSFDEGPCPEPEIQESSTVCADCLEKQHLEEALKKIAEDDSLNPIPHPDSLDDQYLEEALRKIAEDEALQPVTRPELDEDQELEEALKRIAEDDSLKPVARTTKDPNAAKVFLRYRDYYAWCKHYANYRWLNVEAEDGDEPFITDEISYYCPGCSKDGSETIIKAMKARGEWEGNSDPWHEEEKTTDAGGSSKIDAIARDPEDDHPSGSGPTYEEPEFDESHAKNKGVPGRPTHHDNTPPHGDDEEAPARLPPGYPDEEDYYSSDHEDDEDYSSDRTPTGPPRGRSHLHAEEHDHPEHSRSPDSRHSHERSLSPPDWSSHGEGDARH